MPNTFRVTESSIASLVLNNLQSSLQKMQDLQNQLSSGRLISRPSDDPSGAVKAMLYRGDQKRTEQYGRNATDGIGWLGTADTTLTTSLEEIRRVRDLVLTAANGTSDRESRNALAAEIRTAKQNLIGLANTTYNNRPIFAGTADPASSGLDTYDSSGNYNGNTKPVYRTVGPSAQVQVNLDGPTVWGTPGIGDLWHILDDIDTHMTSSDSTEVEKLLKGYTDPLNGPMSSDLDRLDAARLNIQNRVSEVGARYHRVEQMQGRSQDNLLTIKEVLAETENIDLPATIVALNLQNAAFQAALSATAKVIQPSLVDFIR